MTTIEDVRLALWNAYKKLQATPEGVCGKSSEGWCELVYPTFWECKTSEEFAQPCGLMVYSYALGPSRRHHFNAGKSNRQVDGNTWESPDFMEKALETVKAWAAKLDA